jgi:transposase-like protein
MRGKGQRRKRASKEKLRIVLAGLDGTTRITDLCRREDINATQYYCWRKQVLGAATRIFAGAKSQSRRPRKRG